MCDEENQKHGSNIYRDIRSYIGKLEKELEIYKSFFTTVSVFHTVHPMGLETIAKITGTEIEITFKKLEEVNSLTADTIIHDEATDIDWSNVEHVKES